MATVDRNFGGICLNILLIRINKTYPDLKNLLDLRNFSNRMYAKTLRELRIAIFGYE